MPTPLRLASLAVAGALLLPACSGVPADMAATVGEAEIPVSALERQLRAAMASPEFAGVPDAERVSQTQQLQQQLLSSLVFQELIRSAADELGVEVTDEDVEGEWQTQIGFAGSEEALLARIEELGLSEEAAREQLEAQLLRDRVQQHFTDEVEVSEAELRDVYEQRLTEFELATYGEIVVASQEEAQAIVDLLAQGADFAELARTRSMDPAAAASEGGTVTRRLGQIDPAIVAALTEATPGEVIGPVATADGRFRVLEFDSFDTVSFAEVRDTLRDEVAAQRSAGDLQAFFGQFVLDTPVDVNGRFGQWDPQSLTVVAPESVGSRSRNL